MKYGTLIISLDFELLWGIFDVVNFRDKEEYFRNTRESIPLVLELFQKYNIHATWATVGMLFNENWEEWENNFPETLPKYDNKQLSAYDFGLKYKAEIPETYCFAPEIISEINKTPGQEVATHSYSHYYCLEKGQTAIDFRSDIEKAVKMSKAMGVALQSLVFPRNQLRKDYLKICREFGIANVRSNPSSWYWKDTTSEKFLVKLNRTGDAYMPLGRKNYPIQQLQPEENLPLQQKASRFLRPVESNVWLRKLKILRIVREMENAAKSNEVYHLWWHPHNFGENPGESIKDLTTILEHYRELKNTYNFNSLNMRELGDLQRHKN